MLPKESPSAAHLGVGAIIGCVVGLGFGLATGRIVPSILAGWAALAITFVASMTWTLWPLDAAATGARATREEPSRQLTHTVALAAALLSLAGVFIVIASGNQEDRIASIVVAVLAALSSWAMIHVLYALRYARNYYGDPKGGIDFHQDEDPQYSDFLYTAFAVGMTFAISDTDLESAQMRKSALAQSLLAYVFGAMILAALINLIAGL